MAYIGSNLGGLGILLRADAHGIGLNLSLRANWWNRLVAARRRRRAVVGLPGGPAVPPAATISTQGSALAQLVASTPWYHSIDLGGGVKTPGRFDHGAILERYRLPPTLTGKRILDVATFDGFWAFEFERRGAAEVVAIDLEGPLDIDFPPRIRAAATAADAARRFGRGFEIAREALNSNVRRVNCNVYQLDPDRLGQFDVVHVGDLLLHLNNPVLALQNVAKVCTGYALISDVYFPELDFAGQGAPLIEYRGGASDTVWWKFSLAALQRMIVDAGFERVELLSAFRYGLRGQPETIHHAVIQAWK